MRALDRKLLRDLWRLKGQVLAIALVVGCGIASYVASGTTYRSLVASRDAFYATNRFADGFAAVQRAPLAAAERVRALPGVADVQARVVVEGRVALPGARASAFGRFVSLERDAGLNALTLRAGRLPEPGRADEVVVGEAFAAANRLRPGDALGAVLRGRRVALVVVGVALSPEYVWIIPAGGFVPDDERYGVFWVERRALERAEGMAGAFNDLALAFSPGADARAVLASVDRILAPYGGLDAYGRDRQASHRLLDQELRQLAGSATLLPLVILAVAMFLLHLLLGRIVAGQREQLAALKALGYTNAEVGSHYALFALAVAGLGALFGIGLGVWGGRTFVDLYATYFRLPVLGYRLAPADLAFGVLLSAGAALLGALGAVARAVRLPAAEAMRPAAPAQRGPTRLERWGALRTFPVAERMVLRDLERQGGRTLLSVLAIALATAIVVAGRLAFDSIDHLMALQFDRVQREDVSIAYTHPLAPAVRGGLAHIPGVRLVERAREVPVRILAGTRRREAVLTGVDEGATLRRLLDLAGRPVPLPAGGLALSRELAARLGVAPGDRVEVEVLEGARPRRALTVAALVDDMIGLGAYMPITALDRLLGGPRDSGAMLAVEPGARDAVIARLEAMPTVLRVSPRARVKALFEAQVARVFLTYQVVLAAFAAVLAVGVVYTNARIALATRGRDLATLRILGFTRAEVGAVLVGEQAVQLLAGIPLGLPIGEGLGHLALASVDRELYRFPVVVSTGTLAFAAAVVLAAGTASAWRVRRMADDLDLVGVLKARD